MSSNMSISKHIYINELNFDCFKHIFDGLNIRELMSCRSVCYQWLQYIDRYLTTKKHFIFNDSVVEDITSSYNKVDLKEPKISYDCKIALASIYYYDKNAIFGKYEVYNVMDKNNQILRSIIPKIPSLVSFKFKKKYFDNNILITLICNNCSDIRELYLNRYNISTKELKLLVLKCPNITHLCLSICEFSGSRLKHLNGFRNLKYLKLKNLIHYSYTNNSYNELNNWKYLSNMSNSIEKFIGNSNKHVIHAITNANFTNLKFIALHDFLSFDLSNNDIKNMIQKQTQLQVLKFTFCPKDSRNTLNLISNLSNLQTLHIKSCDYSFNCDRESVLALVKGCPLLEDIKFMTRCHKKNSIFIEYEPDINDDGLTELSRLTKLKILVLNWFQITQNGIIKIIESTKLHHLFVKVYNTKDNYLVSNVYDIINALDIKSSSQPKYKSHVYYIIDIEDCSDPINNFSIKFEF